MPDIAALTHAALGRALTATERLAVAVSGGPDSLALLILAAAAWPGRVSAVTVDHRLRAGSAAEAATVAAQCAAAGIPHAILPWAGDKPVAGLQGAARAARYALMADWCAAAGIALLLTAHHADDQAETLLMRLGRGAGSAGLAGIRVQRPLSHHVTLLRPLLAVRRQQLAEVVAAAGWQAIADPSNHDPRFQRSQARAVLAATPWLDAGRMAAAVAHVAETEAGLDWAVDRAWAGRVTLADGAISIDAAGLPAALTRRLLARAIDALCPGQPPDGADLDRLHSRLAAGGTGTLAGVQAGGGVIWRCHPAPPRRERR